MKSLLPHGHGHAKDVCVILLDQDCKAEDSSVYVTYWDLVLDLNCRGCVSMSLTLVTYLPAMIVAFR